jgi:hypothetical protein
VSDGVERREPWCSSLKLSADLNPARLNPPARGWAGSTVRTSRQLWPPSSVRQSTKVCCTSVDGCCPGPAAVPSRYQPRWGSRKTNDAKPSLRRPGRYKLFQFRPPSSVE